MNEFGLTEFKESGLLFRFSAGAGSARVADSGWAVVIVGHGPEHIDELFFVFGLHVN